jgi:drug/metabolite transporter (DMT)-like permease
VTIILFATVPLEQFSFSNMFLLGSLFVLLSALCWAVYSIVGKTLLRTYDEITIITYAFIIGTLLYIPVVAPTITTTIHTMSFAAWGSVLYLALFCSIFAYLGWYYALKRIEAAKAAVFLNLIPLFTMIMAVLLGYQLTIGFIIGAMLIIGGVYLTQQARTRSSL